MGTSLVTKFADKFGIAPDKMLPALTATAFKQKQGVAITNEQMLSLLVVANEYGLNPWTKEIYAFPTKGGGIVPIVGVDGWCRIINDNPAFDGMDFSQSTETETPQDGKRCPEWMECAIHRKDRSHPIVVREYIDEVYRPPFKGKDYTASGPWQTHTKRMLRHKVMIQCARLAFGFSGVYDQDEGERILEGEVISVEHGVPNTSPWEGEVDNIKVEEAAILIRQVIDLDEIENHQEIKNAYNALNQNEVIALNGRLKDKPEGAKKMYKSIMRDYIDHQPDDSI